ncbi:MAG: DUF4349 domain-containing protein [Defluviitaleaceae bacterium]|nr:DUF4349 domain-containing protein [Defluviitaleaceae bacterium]
MKFRFFAAALSATLVLSACAAPHQTLPAPAPAAGNQVFSATEADGVFTSWAGDFVEVQYGYALGAAAAEMVMPQEQRRIATIASIDMRVDYFDGAVTAIRELVWLKGGFVERADTFMRGGLGSDNFSATLRVPAEGYDSFVEELGQLGEITFMSEATEDHSAAFFDASIRLSTRTIEEERILALLERAQEAGEVSEILELEHLLRNVRLEIEGLTRQIDHIDRLVAFHTIHLSLFEASDDHIAVVMSFAERSGRAFRQSVDHIMTFSRGVVLFVVAAIAPVTVLMVFGLVALVAVRRIGKFRAGR